jgi:hypothetical protein
LLKIGSKMPPTDDHGSTDDNPKDDAHPPTRILPEAAIEERIPTEDTASVHAAIAGVRAFQCQTHGLRINVSELAACAGFHPYKSLPKVLYGHVYQGIPGQALLRQDAALLGLTIVSDQQVWRELAQKAGASTQQALQQALQVPTGQTKLASVEAAEELRKKVLHEAKASKKLSSKQVATLEEGARHSIHTGFGTVWESQALDLYEQQCGWEVTERNAQVRVWDFDSSGKELRSPRPAYRERRPREESGDLVRIVEDGRKDDDSSSGIKRQKVDSCEAVAVVDLISGGTEVGDTKQQSQSILPNLPYFSLRGSVDGIRQEMAPVAKQNNKSKNECHNADDDIDDDTTWEFRRVIVECKHRMSRLQPSPPIYEMIQATVYCLMYDSAEVDLVQVLRHRQKPRRQTKPSTVKTSQNEEKENEKSANKITEYFPSDKVDADNEASGVPDKAAEKASQPVEGESQDNAAAAAASDGAPVERGSVASGKEATSSTPAGKDETSPSMEIAVSRISIDDPIFQHRENWNSIILPNLRSWTQAVYAVRKDDDTRYRLLTALLAENLRDAWGVLLEECPWLRRCDTSYHRDVSTST